MSCTIDRLTILCRGSLGSVLMEFMIVLPIYFILFGYVFLVGDLGLKTISLAIGDRDAAMDAGDRLGYSYSLFDGNQIVDDGLQSAQSMTLRADEDFKGAWSWQAAGLSKFTYQLPNWMSGFIIYPYRLFGSEGSGGALVTLARGNSVELRSKDVDNVRIYNYYTLKRTNLSRESENCRNWAADKLVEGGLSPYWYTSVYREQYADSSGSRLDSDGPTQGRDENPSMPSGEDIYKRYGQFMRWSQ